VKTRVVREYAVETCLVYLYLFENYLIVITQLCTFVGYKFATSPILYIKMLLLDVFDENIIDRTHEVIQAHRVLLVCRFDERCPKGKGNTFSRISPPVVPIIARVITCIGRTTPEVGRAVRSVSSYRKPIKQSQSVIYLAVHRSPFVPLTDVYIYIKILNIAIITLGAGRPHVERMFYYVAFNARGSVDKVATRGEKKWYRTGTI